MQYLRNVNCDTCAILNDSQGEIIIFTTEHWTVRLARDQLYLGRAYLVALNHIREIEDLTKEQLIDWHDSIKRYSAMAKKAFGATHITEATLMNNAYQSATPNPHVHTHIRPRYKTPYYFPGWDMTFADPNFGHHHLGSENAIEFNRELLVAIGYQLRASERPITPQ